MFRFPLNTKNRKINASQMLSANIPRQYWPVTIDKIPDTCKYKKELELIRKDIQKYIRDGQSYMFFGDYGSGKTSGSVCIAKEIISRGGTSLMVKASKIGSLWLDNTLFDEDYTAREVMEDCHLLIIDDLGIEYATEFNQRFLEEVIRYRYDHKLSVIITTNLGTKDLQEKLGRSALSVLKHMAKNIEFSGKDWRS